MILYLGRALTTELRFIIAHTSHIRLTLAIQSSELTANR